MIVELAGLPGVGKSTFARSLETQLQVPVVKLSVPLVVLYASIFFLTHISVAFTLLRVLDASATHNVALKRSLRINAWLFPMAKYQYARLHGGIIDQGFVQSLLSALITDEKTIQKLTRTLPHADVLVLCEEDEIVRKERLDARRGKPREEISKAEFERFLREAPSSYEAIRTYVYHPKEAVVLNPAHSSSVSIVVSRTRIKTERPIVQLLKHLLYSICYVFTLSRKPTMHILMYHAVNTSGWKHAIEPVSFEAQIAWLSKHRNVVSLADVVSYVSGDMVLTRSAVTVTFDDGYEDFLRVAVPILEKYKIPATLFLTTDLAHNTNSRHTKRLSEKEVQTLAKHPLITIESHARTHRRLPTLQLEEVQKELVQSKRDIEMLTDTIPAFFAYAYGDRSPEVEREAQKAGYVAAFAITEGSVKPDDDLFHLKRVQVDSTMTPMLFRLRVTHALDAYASFLKIFRIRT